MCACRRTNRNWNWSFKLSREGFAAHLPSKHLIHWPSESFSIFQSFSDSGSGSHSRLTCFSFLRRFGVGVPGFGSSSGCNGGRCSWTGCNGGRFSKRSSSIPSICLRTCCFHWKQGAVANRHIQTEPFDQSIISILGRSLRNVKRNSPCKRLKQSQVYVETFAVNCKSPSKTQNSKTSSLIYQMLHFTRVGETQFV